MQQHGVCSGASVACECVRAGAGRARVQNVEAEAVFSAAASAAKTACVQERIKGGGSRAVVYGRQCTGGAGASAGQNVCEERQNNAHTQRWQMKAADVVAATWQAASTSPVIRAP